MFVAMDTAPGVAGPCAEATALFETASPNKLNRTSVAFVACEIFSNNWSSVSVDSTSVPAITGATGKEKFSTDFMLETYVLKVFREAFEFDLSLVIGGVAIELFRAGCIVDEED